MTSGSLLGGRIRLSPHVVFVDRFFDASQRDVFGDGSDPAVALDAFFGSKDPVVLSLKSRGKYLEVDVAELLDDAISR